jgi:hypothetical protein
LRGRPNKVNRQAVACGGVAVEYPGPHQNGAAQFFCPHSFSAATPATPPHRMVERHYGHLAQSYITEAIHAAAPRYGVKPTKRVVPLRG